MIETTKREREFNKVIIEGNNFFSNSFATNT